MSDALSVPIKVYTYGGCSSCGSTFFNFLRQQNTKITLVNVQIKVERDDITRRALEQGHETVRFPIVEVGGTIIVGFKPLELEQLINEERSKL